MHPRDRVGGHSCENLRYRSGRYPIAMQTVYCPILSSRQAQLQAYAAIAPSLILAGCNPKLQVSEP